MSKITVRNLFEHFGLEVFEKLRWGESANERYGGVYVVSTASNPNLNTNGPELPEIDSKSVEIWCKNDPELKLYRSKFPSFDLIKIELWSHWHSKENILYIGKASDMGKRLNQFYRHKPGKSSPHAGGQWIKVLKGCDNLYIYTAACDNPDETEFKLLLKFAEMLSGKPYDQIKNLGKYFPFANLNTAINKKHGFKGSKTYF